jgi:glycerol 3-phosphatase-2
VADPVFRRYDALLVDLDGVLYRGDQPIPEAPGVVERLRGSGPRVVFLTNNSARTPEEVAGKLRGMGIPADPRDVLTSAVATAAMLRRPGTSGAGTAFVIGGPGIRQALEGIGVRVVDGTAERADLVVVGWDPEVRYDDLRTAGLMVQRGARLIGTNPDRSYPAPDGLWPGAGALLAAVVATTGATPTVVGKPAAPMFEAAADLVGATAPLVVGDRLDTDIAGAAERGWDSMLVLTGASNPRDLPGAAALPTYVGATIAAVEDPLPRVVVRPARDGELPEAAELIRAAGLPPPATDPADGDVLVAVRSLGRGLQGRAAPAGDGDVLATASVLRVDGVAVVRAVAVRHDVRGARLGMLVVAAAIRRAIGAGAKGLFAFTETAEGFLVRMGFRPTERAELPDAVRESEHATGVCATAIPLVWDVPPPA